MSGRTPSVTAALVAATMVTGAVVTAPGAQAADAAVARIVVAPYGNDLNAGDLDRPVATLGKAQEMARALADETDVVVELASGVYRLSKPLELTGADSGRNGHTVTWRAMPGATPMVSGGEPVTGWTLQDSGQNIWVAPVPQGVDSRQLYVDGVLAPRASIPISRTDVQITTIGMTITNPALNFLATLPQQNRIEVESQNSFTNRYSPVQSISGTTITMQQPAWNNNNWGYDTLARPFAGGQLFLANSYSFLRTAGQWYLDPQAGRLYYRAAAGQSPVGHEVILPRLTSLVRLSGSYADPIRNITMQGMIFEHTTWLTPGTSIGYANQQSGTFIPTAHQMPPDFLSSCQSGCQLFEGARNGWAQVPAAVQVSAATGITFADNTFRHLGQVGLGIGNDANAHASGIGLGASNVTVSHNTFTDISGGAIVVGGVRPDAHHPSNPAMVNRDITIRNNLVTDVAKDYKDMAGILSTYVTHTVIEHNEVSNLAYDGIDVGWGWGANDAGGSQDYRNRGLYNFQPVYTTPTTLRDTIVRFNLVHGTKKVFHDGGSIYNLSANPGGSIDHNLIYDNRGTVGLYLDEGSRFVNVSNNVIVDAGVWAFTNANSSNNTNDNIFAGNWFNTGATQVATGPPHNNVLSGNVQVSGTWPTAAGQVMAQAGIEPNLRSNISDVLALGAAKCLDVNGASTAPGTQLQIWACNGGSNQIWTRTPSGQLTVYSGNNTRCMAALNNQTTSGTPVVIAQCTGTAGQQWRFNANGTVTGVGSNLCLDINGGATANGAKTILWTCHGGSNQQWAF
ncbi:MAG TPA: ricin-type beta-trefoil lectin domain protein [Actinophytocola sp.]|uniref:ricin-type beta-trefoil lectin domain protein n=1 Tax=Actinophytocola sp. TaxID=1872138 RepID=UPI002DDD5567|nr:ricin-type beta-trefoil lectin domain protein [Actinophytocola sp.]HEV2784501.1 ricin-type beta-trefoil lectin domain protein [Actinophytocola sp.]